MKIWESKEKRVVLITWVSASWKTCLQEELIKLWWARPNNYTTRKPRGETPQSVDSDWDFDSREFWEYIFLNKQNFLKKIWNWDFLENVKYWDHFYGVSKFMPANNNICIIVDPSGRAQATAELRKRGYNVTTVYIEINEETQKQRLLDRGDEQAEIWKRAFDFQWFVPTSKCIRLSWLEDSNKLADVLCRIVNKKNNE